MSLNRRLLNCISFSKVEIVGNGTLIVDGGNEKRAKLKTHQGGGAGGIIQIISPMGNLTANSLSLRPGTSPPAGICKTASTKAHGYYYLQGKSIQRSLMRLVNFLISSSVFLVLAQDGGRSRHSCAPLSYSSATATEGKIKLCKY